MIVYVRMCIETYHSCHRSCTRPRGLWKEKNVAKIRTEPKVKKRKRRAANGERTGRHISNNRHLGLEARLRHKLGLNPRQFCLPNMSHAQGLPRGKRSHISICGSKMCRSRTHRFYPLFFRKMLARHLRMFLLAHHTVPKKLCGRPVGLWSICVMKERDSCSRAAFCSALFFLLPLFSTRPCSARRFQSTRAKRHAPHHAPAFWH